MLGHYKERPLISIHYYEISHLPCASVNSQAVQRCESVYGCSHVGFNITQPKTVEAITNNKTATLVSSIRSIIEIYKKFRFEVNATLMDGEFVHLQGELEKGWTLQGSLLKLWMDENASQQSNKNR